MAQGCGCYLQGAWLRRAIVWDRRKSTSGRSVNCSWNDSGRVHLGPFRHHRLFLQPRWSAALVHRGIGPCSPSCPDGERISSSPAWLDWPERRGVPSSSTGSKTGPVRRLSASVPAINPSANSFLFVFFSERKNLLLLDVVEILAENAQSGFEIATFFFGPKRCRVAGGDCAHLPPPEGFFHVVAALQQQVKGLKVKKQNRNQINYLLIEFMGERNYVN